MNARAVAYTKAGLDVHRQNVVKAVRLPKLHGSENFLVVVDTEPERRGESLLDAFVMSSRDGCCEFIKSDGIIRYLMSGRTRQQVRNAEECIQRRFVAGELNETWEIINERVRRLIRGMRKLQRRSRGLGVKKVSMVNDRHEMGDSYMFEVVVGLSLGSRPGAVSEYRIDMRGDISAI